jgi:hypothetical protein
MYLSLIMLFMFSIPVDAKKITYEFSPVVGLHKMEMLHGSMQQTKFCENKIDIKLDDDMSKYIFDSEIYVSPDERLLIFQGSYGRHSDPQWFLVDIRQCKMLKELTVGISRPPIVKGFLYKITHQVYDYHVAYSPDSKKIYISWGIVSSEEEPQRWLTKEYSGDGFKNERVLRNINIPNTIQDLERYVRNQYIFSANGKYLVATLFRKDWYLSVYDVEKDEEIFRMKNSNDFFGKKKVKALVPPDISDGLLLFNFESDGGTEISIFDYENKKVKNKVELPLQGSGMFASGSRIIFSSFPDPKTWQKEIIVMDTNTGKQLGKTTLDEADEIVDVSADGTQVIYKRGNIEKKTGIK